MSMSNMKALKVPVIFRWFFKPNLDLGNIFLRLKMKDVPNNGCLNWKKLVTRLWERNWSICKLFYVRKPAVIPSEVIEIFVKSWFLDRNSVKSTVLQKFRESKTEILWNRLFDLISRKIRITYILYHCINSQSKTLRNFLPFRFYVKSLFFGVS